MKKNEGYILLRSLLSIAVILVCSAVFFATLAVAIRQSGHLESRMNEDFSFRREKILQRLK